MQVECLEKIGKHVEDFGAAMTGEVAGVEESDNLGHVPTIDAIWPAGSHMIVHFLVIVATAAVFAEQVFQVICKSSV